MKISKTWAMPNKNTLQIKPIRELSLKYISGFSLDPFANSCDIAFFTNDIDPQYGADFHLDALDFIKLFKDNVVDSLIFDPPFSSRQISESYKKVGKTVNMETTQGSFWRKLKQEIQRVVKPNGYVVSCGWNSGGIEKNMDLNK